MTEQEKLEETELQKKRAADNIKLAILLGLTSVGIYVVYIVWHFL